MANKFNFTETRLLGWGQNKKEHIFYLEYLGDGEKLQITAPTKAELRKIAKKLTIELDPTYKKEA